MTTFEIMSLVLQATSLCVWAAVLLILMKRR